MRHVLKDVLWLDEDNRSASAGVRPLKKSRKIIGLPLDSPQVETIGGYLCELAGRVPSVGESFSLSASTCHCQRSGRETNPLD